MIPMDNPLVYPFVYIIIALEGYCENRVPLDTASQLVLAKYDAPVPSEVYVLLQTVCCQLVVSVECGHFMSRFIGSMYFALCVLCPEDGKSYILLTCMLCSVYSLPTGILRATLTEVFPCLFLSCKVNARVYLAKTGHDQHSS